MADNFWQGDTPVKTPVPPDNFWQGDEAVGGTSPSLVHEAAAVGITGPIKGAVSATIGLPGDVEAGLKWLVGKGVLSLGDLVGLPRPSQQALGDQVTGDQSKVPLVDRYAPTSANIVKGIEKATGPLPEAQTEAGKIGEAVTEFAPGALAMGPAQGVKGAASNLTKLAVLPGAGSEVLGHQVEGTWLEPIARLAGALGGGALGSGAAKIAEAAANRGAAANAAREAGGNVKPAALAKVAKNFQADELTPQAVAQKQSDLGPEAMMLDMGRQLQGRAEAIASQPGKGQNTVLDAVEGRTGIFGSGTAQRVNDTLDRVMGPSPDIVAAKNGINAAVDQIAKPLYDQVMSAHPVVSVPAGITSRPAVAQAMKDAVSLAKNHGEELAGPTETKTILSGPGYHIADDVENPAKTSLGYWDYVKKALDSRINGMMKSGGIQDLNSADKADLSGLMDARNALVNHLDNVTGGAYGVARRGAATKFQVNDAVDLGRSALNTKLLPEELADNMQGMSMPEQAGVKLGMRREIDRIIDTARNDGAAARRTLDTNQNREKIAQVFGQPAADAVDQRVAAETQFQDATNKVASNSRTAVRGQLMKDTEAPSLSGPPVANIGGLALAGLRRGREYLGDLSLERTREGIADLLTRRGQELPRLAQILSGYNAARVANTATPIGRQAKGLAAVLSGQTPGWVTGFLPGNGPSGQQPR